MQVIMPDRFEDERGVIQDLLGPIDAVTEIVTKAGAVRGNHVHQQTTQWTYVISGRLLVASTHVWGQPGECPECGSVMAHACTGIRPTPALETFGPGEMACEEPGIAHAWRALEDTQVLVFTRGPRSGADYESDTERLKVPLL